MVKVLLLNEIGCLNSEHVINNIILMPFSPHRTSPQNQSILGEIKSQRIFPKSQIILIKLLLIFPNSDLVFKDVIVN